MRISNLMLTLAAATIFASCHSTTTPDNTTGSTDTAVLKNDTTPPVATPAAANRWQDVNWNAPVIKYDEIKSSDVSVRGNDHYSIYSLGENVLFATGKADINKAAESNLSNIVASINQHYPNGYVKVYGYTDSTGSTGSNNQLSAQRAQAVATWLTAGGKLQSDKVSVFGAGEARPVASNGTSDGRAQNRRVEIVVTK